MSVIALTVTEFSRGLSNFLNQVQYQGQTLDIQRGKKLVARVLPAGTTDGFPIDRLDAKARNEVECPNHYTGLWSIILELKTRSSPSVFMV